MQHKEKPTESQENILHYMAYSLLVIALGVVSYLYIEANDRVVLSQDKMQKSTGFRDLPQYIQAEYKSVNEYKSLEMKLKSALEQNERLMMMQREEKTAPKMLSEVKSEVQSEVSKEPESLSETPRDAKLVKEFASCYDMEMGSYIISWTCKKNIISFIEKHKNAKYFELISLVDDSEFILYKNLQNNDFIYDKLGVTQKSIDKMKKLTQAGLAKHRAVEANWVIKAHTNRKAKVYSANYHLISHEEKRGVLVRAYE
jgi:UDP-2,3-diacylglucosamine pyrophosphatase LpxH